MEKSAYLSIAQVAKILKISRIAVYKKVKKGEIEAMRIGKVFAIPRDYVLQRIRKIKGSPLAEEEKKRVHKVVDKTISEYGEVLRRLGSE